MATVLGNAIDFLTAFGFFDVVLPFLLVFTVTFGVLEKSNLFGAGKKNLNAMIAFTVGFLVVAATQITQAIQLSIPKVAFMLIILISLLILVGSLMGKQEAGLDFFTKFTNLQSPLVIIIIVAVIAVFFSSVGWLQPIIDFFRVNIASPTLSSLIFLLIIGGIIYYIIREPKNKSG